MSYRLPATAGHSSEFPFMQGRLYHQSHIPIKSCSRKGALSNDDICMYVCLSVCLSICLYLSVLLSLFVCRQSHIIYVRLVYINEQTNQPKNLGHCWDQRPGTMKVDYRMQYYDVSADQDGERLHANIYIVM